MALERIIALVDMDCFYVQVEQRAQPSLKGKPCAVVQYNTWKGGGIIAVGYEARAFGVTRQMRGDDAKAKCPDITLVQVPVVRGKADLQRYREAGAEVIDVLCQFSSCVERASVDEAYVDLTQEVEKRMCSENSQFVDTSHLPNTYIVGSDGKDHDNKDIGRQEGTSSWLTSIFQDKDYSHNDCRLAYGAVIAEEMRAAVYEQTGFRCSAGVAHNKMLSKLVCGFNKPNKQTVLPHNSVKQLFATLPVNKVRHFGGKFGCQVMTELGVENMGDLTKFSERVLQEKIGDKSGLWLYSVCRGIEHEPVSARQLAKSIGCSKNFTGKNCLNTKEKVRLWLGELAKELEERLLKDKENNKRISKNMTVHLQCDDNRSVSRAVAVVRYEAVKLADDAFAVLSKLNKAPAHSPAWTPSVTNLGMSAGKFEDLSTNSASSTIKNFFSQNTTFTNSQKMIDSNRDSSFSALKPAMNGSVTSLEILNTPSNSDLDSPYVRTSDVSSSVKRGKKRKSGPLEGMFKAIESANKIKRSAEEAVSSLNGVAVVDKKISSSDKLMGHNASKEKGFFARMQEQYKQQQKKQDKLDQYENERAIKNTVCLNKNKIKLLDSVGSYSDSDDFEATDSTHTYSSLNERKVFDKGESSNKTDLHCVQTISDSERDIDVCNRLEDIHNVNNADFNCDNMASERLTTQNPVRQDINYSVKNNKPSMTTEITSLFENNHKSNECSNFQNTTTGGCQQKPDIASDRDVKWKPPSGNECQTSDVNLESNLLSDANSDAKGGNSICSSSTTHRDYGATSSSLSADVADINSFQSGHFLTPFIFKTYFFTWKNVHQVICSEILLIVFTTLQRFCYIL